MKNILTLYTLATFLAIPLLCVASPEENIPVENTAPSLTPNQAEQTYREIRKTPPAGAVAIGPTATPEPSRYLILEFSDLQCPDSAKFFQTHKKLLMQQFVNNNRARYEWRDFPLDSHPDAPLAAVAGVCAGNKADAMREKIMGNQASLSEANYVAYAKELGINSARFQTCLRSPNSQGAVRADVHYGKQMGVSGTPTLVVGKLNDKNQLVPLKVIRADKEPLQKMISEIDKALQM